ncbi:hypothetical protein F4803DRAFT_135804 [Xylaria telfairii]|nr:hypothetical protein F4803DRAFT_135804 [Xylaria telfairii]
MSRYIEHFCRMSCPGQWHITFRVGNRDMFETLLYPMASGGSTRQTQPQSSRPLGRGHNRAPHAGGWLPRPWDGNLHFRMPGRGTYTLRGPTPVHRIDVCVSSCLKLVTSIVEQVRFGIADCFSFQSNNGTAPGLISLEHHWLGTNGFGFFRGGLPDDTISLGRLCVCFGFFFLFFWVGGFPDSLVLTTFMTPLLYVMIMIIPRVFPKKMARR